MLWRRRDESELEDEIRNHIALETDDNIARGMTPDEARYAAMRKFGSVARAQEDTRAVWVAPWFDTLAADVRHAIRRLARAPGTSAVVVLSLALAFIPNVALFSVLDHFFLTPLPIERPDEILAITFRDTRSETGFRYEQVSYPEVLDFERSLKSVTGIAYQRRQGVVGKRNGQVAVLWAALVNDGYFGVLGIPVKHGPGLLPDRRAVVISHAMWDRDFGARAEAVGQTLLLNGESYVIQGVAPEGFRGVDGVLPIDAWIPIRSVLESNSRFRAGTDSREYRHGLLWARVRPGVPPARATEEIEAFGRAMAVDWPATNRYLKAVTYNPVNDLTRRNLVATSAGVLLLGILLAVACANVAGVLLARAEERRHETAIRQSLGAPRNRLIREWMIESAMLGSTAALIGIAGAQMLTAYIPPLPTVIPVQLEASRGPHVWLYAAAMAALSTVAFGLIPAWKGSRSDLLAGLRHDSAITVLRGRVPVRSLLVVGQISAAQFLLFLAGLSLDALSNLGRVSAGIEPDRPIAVAMVVPSNSDGSQGTLDYDALEARLAAVSGVRRVAHGHTLPLSGVRGHTAKLERPGRDALDVLQMSCGPGFLSLLGVRVVAGRDLAPSDEHGVIVNRELAALLGGDGAAMGQHVRVGNNTAEVVGVFQDTAWNMIGEAAQPRVVTLGSTRSSSEGTLAIEVFGDPGAYLAPLRGALADAAPGALVLFTKTLRQHYEDALFLQRTGTRMLYAIALLAVVLTITGLHGITTALFLRRSKEFAIRLAIGARPSQIVRAVLSNGCVLAGVGVVVGLALALPVGILVASRVQGVSVFSVYTLGVGSLIVVAAVAVAMLQPARRVLRLQAAEVLRGE